MKKLISFFMMVAILTSSAMASSHDGVKAAIDEFQYALTVEWDQKNQAFHDQKVNELVQDLSKLNLSSKELMSAVKAQINDKNIAKEFEEVVAISVAKNLSLEETAKMLAPRINAIYGKGASWNGNAGAILGGAVLITILAGFALVIGCSLKTQSEYGEVRPMGYCF